MSKDLEQLFSTKLFPRATPKIFKLGRTSLSQGIGEINKVLFLKDAHNLEHGSCQNENISSAICFAHTKYVYLQRGINFLSNHGTHIKSKKKAFGEKIIEHFYES